MHFKAIRVYEEAKDKIKNRPVLFIDNTKSKEETKKSTQGVDTMKKNCYRRKDGRWQYSKQENGLLYYAIANTYRELIEKIKLIQPRKIKNVTKLRGKVITFIQYFETYIETYIKPKPIKEASKNEWTHHLEHYIKPYAQKMPLEKMTTEQLQKIINSIKYERTRERVLQKIKKVIQKAYLSGKIKKDISLGLEKPIRTQTQERPPLTFEEQKALLQKARTSKAYAFIMFSLIVGSRREETVKFDISNDLDETKMQIHIKGTKTKNADRYVSITKEFIEFLKVNLPNGRFEHKKDFYTKQVRDLFKELDIKNCLHGLRHTCAGNLYFLGAKDKYRQMQLGHSSIVTTNDIYTNIKENISKAELLELYGNLYPRFD